MRLFLLIDPPTTAMNYGRCSVFAFDKSGAVSAEGTDARRESVPSS